MYVCNLVPCYIFCYLLHPSLQSLQCLSLSPFPPPISLSLSLITIANSSIVYNFVTKSLVTLCNEISCNNMKSLVV